MLPSIIYKNRGHFTPKESFGLEGRLNPHLPFRQSQVCECGRMQQCYLLRSQMFLHLCLCSVNSYNLFALSKPWHPLEWRWGESNPCPEQQTLQPLEHFIYYHKSRWMQVQSIFFVPDRILVDLCIVLKSQGNTNILPFLGETFTLSVKNKVSPPSKSSFK